MDITDIRIKPVENGNGKLKALASVTLDNEFVIHNVKVIDSAKGLFVGMPSIKDNGEYRDVCHPLNTKVREKFQSAVLKKYEEAMADT